MKNKVEIGDSNEINDSIIAGGDATVVNSKPAKKKAFLSWLRKHLETIIAAAISGAVSAIVAAIVTYFLTR